MNYDGYTKAKNYQTIFSWRNIIRTEYSSHAYALYIPRKLYMNSRKKEEIFFSWQPSVVN